MHHTCVAPRFTRIRYGTWRGSDGWMSECGTFMLAPDDFHSKLERCCFHLGGKYLPLPLRTLKGGSSCTSLPRPGTSLPLLFGPFLLYSFLPLRSSHPHCYPLSSSLTPQLSVVPPELETSSLSYGRRIHRGKRLFIFSIDATHSAH